MPRRSRKKRIAVLASGTGTNLGAILQAIHSGKLRRVELRLVISDKAGSLVLARARRAGVTSVFIHPPSFRSRRAFEHELERHLRADKIDFVILAGFMRILSPAFIRHFKHRILNIHPALLPSFKGVRAIRDALHFGVRVTGVTVHFATADLDAGPIVLQEAIRIRSHDNARTLLARMHRVEHRLYPKAIQLVADGRIKVRKGKAVLVK